MGSSRGSPGPYHHGESVKRHLETFDLELGLNEVGHIDSRISETANTFSRSQKQAAKRWSLLGNSQTRLITCIDLESLQLYLR